MTLKDDGGGSELHENKCNACTGEQLLLYFNIKPFQLQYLQTLRENLALVFSSSLIRLTVIAPPMTLKEDGGGSELQ